MGLRSISSGFLQLAVLIFQLLLELQLALLLEWVSAVFDLFQVPVPALLKPRGVQVMDKIRKFFRRENIRDGEAGDRLYQVPVYQRQDGAIVKLGCPVTREGGRNYHVKNILVRADLERVHVVLLPLEPARDKNLEQAEEEMTVEVGDIEISKERSINVSLARDSMQTVAQTASSSPLHVQVELS